MAVTDANGNIVETYNYTPYGELIDGEYRQDISFLYNGQYGVITDSNGLYYMRARYYNVDIKRFINQDVLLGVLERVSSLNRYAYVEGNPVSYLDPFGLAIEVLQNVVSLLSTVVSGLTLLALVLPEVAFVISSILAISSVILGVIQLYRYDASQDKAVELFESTERMIIDTLSPFGMLQPLIDVLYDLFRNS